MRIPNLSSIADLTIMPEGEYDLKVVSAKDIQNAAKDRDAIFLNCKIIGEESAKPVFHKLWLGNEADDKEKYDGMMRRIKEFAVAVGLDPDDLETEHFAGIEFTALLKVTNYKGEDNNEIARVV